MLSILLSSAPDAAAAVEPLVSLSTQAATFTIDSNGTLGAIVRKENGRDYRAPGQPAPLLSLRVGGNWLHPQTAEWNARQKRLTLHYPGQGARAVIIATAKRTHVVFEIKEVQSPVPVEIALWGPYPTTIRSIIGETVGVVRDGEFAIGIQALNPKTLGGYPTHENDIEQEPSGDDLGVYSNLEPDLLKEQHYRGDTALRTDFGSTLQAFCRNRDQERILSNWGHDRYKVQSFSDGGPIGSKIALFACSAAHALATISAIEVAEGLPHPTLNGVWAKTAPEATAAYLIVDFSEATIDRAIEMTHRAGLRYLYHSSPFETWGHFRLKTDLFPHGWDGLRACVEKARAAGISLGFHTLSNFITPNDPYVSPKPDPRLARIGEGVLTSAIAPIDTEIAVAAPDFYRKKTTLNTVVIGDELIRYDAVSEERPYRLLKCQRGAFGTAAAAHPSGAIVGKLLDHDYQVFLSDANLSLEIARNIAALFNRTGCLQLSFDGLEGNWSTGYGQYGRTLFTNAWYEALSPELKGRVINDASNPGHFNWHINTRMNWGEPWYAGFRESQTLYRFKNQVYFERNLMPHMLGWFALRPDTSVEDAEWLLARAAGFDAGFALATSLASTAQLAAAPDSAEASRLFGATGEILEAVRQWETARVSGAFPEEVKAALRDNHRGFTLRALGERQWELQEARYVRFSLETAQNRSGDFTFDNSEAEQALFWSLHSTATHVVKGIHVSVDEKVVLNLSDVGIPPGGHIRYRGGADAVITDAAWREVQRVPIPSDARRIAPGPHTGCIQIEDTGDGSLKLEIRLLRPSIRLSAKKRR